MDRNEQGKASASEEETPSEGRRPLRFRRGKECVTTSGADHEIGMLALVNVRAKRAGLTFDLGCNVEGANPLDDLVLRLEWAEGGERRTVTYFCQTKQAGKGRTVCIEDFSEENKNKNRHYYIMKYFKFFKTLRNGSLTNSDKTNENNILENCSVETCKFVIHTTRDFVSGNEYLEPPKQEIFPYLELFLTTPENSTFVFKTETPVWNMCTEDDDCEMFKNEFLPNLVLFVSQKKTNELPKLIKEELENYLDEIVPDMFSNMYVESKIRAWWKARKANCLSESSLEIAECFKSYLEQISRHKLIFTEEACSELSNRTSASNLVHVILPGMLVGNVSAVKLAQSNDREKCMVINEINACLLHSKMRVCLTKLCDTIIFEVNTFTDSMESFLRYIISNTQVKILLVSNGANSKLKNFLASQNFYETEDDWSLKQIIPKTKKELYEQSVTFQGSEIKLKDMKDQVPNLEYCFDAQALIDLTHGTLCIGGVPHETSPNYESRALEAVISDYDSSRYFSRTESRATPDWVTESPHKKITNLTPPNQIIFSIKPKNLYDSSTPLFPSSLKPIGERSVIVSGVSGIGKSELLKKVFQDLKLRDPLRLVIYLDLNKCNGEFMHYPAETESITLDHVVQLLGKIGMGSESFLTENIIKNSLNFSDNVVILMDSVSEICPTFREKAMKVLDLLLKTRIKQLWVASRLETTPDLEDKLTTVSVRFSHFETRQKINMIFRHLLEKCTDTHHSHLYCILEEMFENKLLAEFCSTPLHAQVLALTCSKYLTVDSKYMTLRNVWESSNLLQLVKNTIAEKFKIFWRKQDVQSGTVREQQDHALEKKYMEIASACVLSNTVTSNNIWVLSEEFLSYAKKDKTGIQDIVSNTRFIYSPLLAYYAAVALKDLFIKKSNIFEELYLNCSSELVHNLFDYLLAEGNPLHEAVLSGCLSNVDKVISSTFDINARDRGGRNALHLAFKHGYENIMRKLLGLVNVGLLDNVLKKDPFWYWNFMDEKKRGQQDPNLYHILYPSSE